MKRQAGIPGSAGLQLGCVTLSKLLELSGPLLSHSFADSVNQGVEIGFARVNCCAEGRGSPYPGALSHDPFLPPFLSDPCGHVTLKRNVLASFKDHCPGSRARSAHTPTQNPDRPRPAGPQESLLQPLPMQWR